MRGIMIAPFLVSLLLMISVCGNEVMNVIIIGGTGNLAQKYLWQGFFNLFIRRTNVLFRFYGSAREPAEQQTSKLLTILNMRVKCYDDSDNGCQQRKAKFINQTQYFQLKTAEDYVKLGQHLANEAKFHTKEIGRVFYLSLPPRAYVSVSRFINNHCRPTNKTTWLRVVLEKPFGQDKSTAENMTSFLQQHFNEEEIYRVDHYLGKAIVQEMIRFREINRERIDQLLNVNQVERVEISMLETVDVKERVDSYDQYGVICDVLQNHVIEMLTLVAMDLPANISDSLQIKDSKLRLLKQILPVQGRSLLKAQYRDYQNHGAEELRQANFSSNTATFAAAAVKLNSPRWHGVPFILVSGKKLKERVSYVRIIFKNNFFHTASSPPFRDSGNTLRQLVFHIEHGTESKPAIFVSKSLGKLYIPDTLRLQTKMLSKNIYGQSSDDMWVFEVRNTVDAYTSVISNIIEGRQENFVGSKHLLALWDIWSVVLASQPTSHPRFYDSETYHMLDFTLLGDDLSFIVGNQEEIEVGTHGQSKMKIIPSLFLGGKLYVNNIDNVISTLVLDIKSLLQRAVEERGSAHLALSGGKTSAVLFRYLAQLGVDIPWLWIHLWFVDERCVSLSDHRSNFLNMQENLLSFVKIPYTNLHPMPVEIAGRLCDSGDNSDALYEETIIYLVPDRKFDVVLLGLGADGHTASLFPRQPSLHISDKLVIHSSAPGSEVTQRMTLTYPVLNLARNIFIFVTGEEKHGILDRVQSPAADMESFPILGVKPSKGNITWYIDDKAFYG